MKWHSLAAGGLLMAALVGAYLVGMQIFRPHATLVSPLGQAQVGAWGPIGLAFDRPMDTESVAKALSFDPPAAFSVQWRGQVARITPREGLKPGVQYTVRLAAGARSQSGSSAAGLDFRFTVRPAEVIFISPVRGPHELWRIPLGGGDAQQITHTGGKLLDFTVSQDGEALAYAVRNAQNGSDIWSASRDGSQPRRLIACGADTCSAEAWSPDGNQIAYTRADGFTETGKPGRVYSASADGGGAAPLDADPSSLGLQPSWSPDGTRIAYYQSGQKSIRILDLRTGGQIFVQSTLPGLANWSPDGSLLFFNDSDSTGAQPYSSVVVFDFAKRAASVLIGSSENVVDAGLPVWSPLGNELAVGLRQVGGTPARQLWLIRPDGTPLKQITNDPQTNAAAYVWDPWGTALVYQTYSLLHLNANPQIAVWQSSTGQTRVLTPDGALPQVQP
jgi:Tol biopolymer transport system component